VYVSPTAEQTTDEITQRRGGGGRNLVISSRIRGIHLRYLFPRFSLREKLGTNKRTDPVRFSVLRTEKKLLRQMANQFFWWRWPESNRRPKRKNRSVYVRSLICFTRAGKKPNKNQHAAAINVREKSAKFFS
jgi:hypothetical protein